MTKLHIGISITGIHLRSCTAQKNKGICSFAESYSMWYEYDCATLEPSPLESASFGNDISVITIHLVLKVRVGRSYS